MFLLFKLMLSRVLDLMVRCDLVTYRMEASSPARRRGLVKTGLESIFLLIIKINILIKQFVFAR